MSVRLPETDLANWSFLSAREKRANAARFLAAKNLSGLSYEPFRAALPSCIDSSLSLFPDETLPAAPWGAIDRLLAKSCARSPDLLKMNRQVANSTKEYAEKSGLVAAPYPFTRITLGAPFRYDFGLPTLFRDAAGQTSAAFLDLRRSGLTSRGRLFVVSAMHQRFRVTHPDFEHIGLEIWDYKGGSERPLVALKDELVYFTYDQLVLDVQETYAILAEEVSSRRYDRRDTAGRGSLL